MAKRRIPSYKIEVMYSAEDQGFIATAPELPRLSAFGETPEAAVRELHEAIRTWLDVARREGRVIPEPVAEKAYSGKLTLRIPKALHRDLDYEARKQGVSLNQYLTTLLARKPAVST